MRYSNKLSKTMGMVDFVTEQLRDLARSGRDYIYMDSLDGLLQDIFEIKNFSKMLFKLRYPEQRIKVLDKIGLDILFALVNNPKDFNVLVDLVGVNYTLVGLKKEIKKLKKNGKKYKQEEKKFKYFLKRYEAAVKILRKKYAGEASKSYKKAFKSLNDFIENDGFRYDDYEHDDYSDYNSYDDYEDDYDDYGTPFDRYMADKERKYGKKESPKKVRHKGRYVGDIYERYIYPENDDDDYDDFDDYDDDDEYDSSLKTDSEVIDHLNDIEDRLDNFGEKLQVLFNTGLGGQVPQSELRRAENDTRKKHVREDGVDINGSLQTLINAVATSVRVSTETNQLLKEYLIDEDDEDDDDMTSFYNESRSVNDGWGRPIDINQKARLEEYDEEDENEYDTDVIRNHDDLINMMNSQQTSIHIPSTPVAEPATSAIHSNDYVKSEIVNTDSEETESAKSAVSANDYHDPNVVTIATGNK